MMFVKVDVKHSSRTRISGGYLVFCLFLPFPLSMRFCQTFQSVVAALGLGAAAASKNIRIRLAGI